MTKARQVHYRKGNLMVKIKGLNSLQKTLSEAQVAFEAVNGELGTLTFNPQDPSSIEAAIIESERLIDERLGAFTENKIIESLIQQMKETFRTALIEKATMARLKEEKFNND